MYQGNILCIGGLDMDKLLIFIGNILYQGWPQCGMCATCISHTSLVQLTQAAKKKIISM